MAEPRRKGTQSRSMLKPRTYFICLTMVLFPDSPPPAEIQAVSVLSHTHTHTLPHLQHPYSMHSLQSGQRDLTTYPAAVIWLLWLRLLRLPSGFSRSLCSGPEPRAPLHLTCIPLQDRESGRATAVSQISVSVPHSLLSRLLSLPIVAKASVSELRSGTGSHSGLLIGRRSQLLLALRIAGVYWAAARAHLISSCSSILMREGQTPLIALTSHEEQGSRTSVLWQPKYNCSSEVVWFGCWRIGYVPRSANFYLCHVMLYYRRPILVLWRRAFFHRMAVSVVYSDMGAIFGCSKVTIAECKFIIKKEKRKSCNCDKVWIYKF